MSPTIARLAILVLLLGSALESGSLVAATSSTQTQNQAALAKPAADPLIEGSKLCTQQLIKYEHQYNMPPYLLSAIATVESGRYYEGLKINIPWPWAINANGKSYFFDSQQQAIDAGMDLQAKGQDIRVGCTQTSPKSFSSLPEALEPEKNIAHAAGILNGFYQKEGSWKTAVADYHSETPKLNRDYVEQVYNTMDKITEKLKSATSAHSTPKQAKCKKSDPARLKYYGYLIHELDQNQKLQVINYLKKTEGNPDPNIDLLVQYPALIAYQHGATVMDGFGTYSPPNLGVIQFTDSDQCIILGISDTTDVVIDIVKGTWRLNAY